MDILPSLLCITTDNSIFSHQEQVLAFIGKGARFVQIRSKAMDKDELGRQVEQSLKHVKESGALLIVNDFLDLARDFAVSGVHLGANDCSVERARELLGADAIIGSTVHNLDDAIKVKELGLCDYVGLGPIRGSRTKLDLAPVLSKETIDEILNLLSPLPVYLIGGIELSDCDLISRYDIAGIAVCSALSQGSGCGNQVGHFIEHLESSNLNMV